MLLPCSLRHLQLPLLLRNLVCFVGERRPLWSSAAPFKCNGLKPPLLSFEFEGSLLEFLRGAIAGCVPRKGGKVVQHVDDLLLV
mmetsp:Transcript_17784/g.12737  ORF Transcript_17784/g.12737 Transcript_17784/m.12737 type:complete len:84 (-) Transcript_17784:2683-2934(-)